MAGRLVLDTWAFFEQWVDGPRRAEVDAAIKASSHLVTSAQVMHETYSFLLRRSRRPPMVREWLDVWMDGRLQVLEPSWKQVQALMGRVPRDVGLSLVDVSLAWAAMEVGAHEVATHDHHFRALRLDPIFAEA